MCMITLTRTLIVTAVTARNTAIAIMITSVAVILVNTYERIYAHGYDYDFLHNRDVNRDRDCDCHRDYNGRSQIIIFVLLLI